ncbi:hypothetical protein ACQP0C_34660 [Nocardia sp. CA-129566]|uniref:hypothetical protein n=1 Tax=Nocardia sp. CA-129566 TaxID=3239976 RepID=UPI003D967197
MSTRQFGYAYCPTPLRMCTPPRSPRRPDRTPIHHHSSLPPASRILRRIAVARFTFETAYLARCDVQQAGGRDILEYWIPAEDLAELNTHIVGKSK